MNNRPSTRQSCMWGNWTQRTIPVRHPTLSNVEILDMKYSRYLRAVLLESIVKKEHQIVSNICADEDVLKTCKERMRLERQKSLMVVANKELKVKVEQIKSPENLIAIYKTLTIPGFHDRLEKLCLSLTSFMDVLPLVNFSVQVNDQKHLRQIKFLGEAGNKLNTVVRRRNLGICANVENYTVSVSELLKQTDVDKLTISEMNHLLLRWMSMKQIVNDEYIRNISNEMIPGSTFADISEQLNFSSIQELDISSDTLSAEVSSDASQVI